MNKKMFTKLFALVLAVCVVFSLAIIVSSAAETSVTYTFSSYTAGTQYAVDEEHVLDDTVTVVTTESHFTTQLRIYSSSTHDGFAIVKSTRPITAIGVSAGNKVDTLVIYGSNDEGATWADAATISVTSTSYKSYTAEFDVAYDWLKIDVKGANQVRLESMTLTTTDPVEPENPDVPTCEHANTEVIPAESATCTEAGKTAGEKCKDCGEVTIAQETIKALGHTGGTATCTKLAVCTTCLEEYGNLAAHNFKNGACTVCETEMPSEATIDFSTTAQRESLTTQSQVWKTNGLVFTNEKGSGSDIVNYSNPVRLYKNTIVTIVGDANISKIVFNANTAAYATSLKTSIGASAVASEKVVTVTLDGTSNTFSVKLTDAQVRLDSVVVTFASGDEPACEHTNTKETTVPATCYVAGSVTVTCVDCGNPISSETIPAAHKFENGVCSVCGVVEAPKAGVAYKLGMYQSTKEAVYYINGQMSGYYMATVTDASAGSYVYLEETEGGYYMYTYLKGVKTYMNMVVSGSYVNAVYANAATTVYTYDANVCAVVASVNNKQYYFGTYSTYTTVGTTYNTTDHIARFYATEQPIAKFDTASVKLGTDLAMIYTVTVPTGTPSMTIEFNGKTVTIDKFTAVDNDTFTFTFAGIGPQQMALNINATLNVDGKAVANFTDYSVEKNLNNIKNAEDATAELVALVNSVLIYGDESENYVGVEGGVDASELANDVAVGDTKYTLENAEAFGFTAAGVNFDAANKIYVKFFVEGEFTLTVNGTAVAVETSEDGNYKVYTDALTATQFADEYVFVITVGEETATLTYSVNAYAAAMQDDAEMGALAQALYAYGVNAKAYVA